MNDNKLELKDIGNKDVRDAFTVAIPILAVLLSTAFHITRYTMDKNNDKEADVKVRQERAKTSDQAPRHGHTQVYTDIE